MMSFFQHCYYLLRATIWLALAFARAGWYFRFRALRDLALPHAEALTSKEKRRLQHYFYGTTYLSAVFCLLRGYPRNAREKHLFTNLAALAYFFDDLVDSFRGRDDSGILWLDNPELFGQTADPRGLALHFLDNIYRELPPGELPQFKEFMHRVFNVETAGRQARADARLRVEDLKNITAEKGGYSVLLFRQVLEHPLFAPEQEALYQFGYLVQLSDDIFDLWHDRKSGTVTLATFLAEQNDVAHLRDIFEEQVAVVRAAFLEIPNLPEVPGNMARPTIGKSRKIKWVIPPALPQRRQSALRTRSANTATRRLPSPPDLTRELGASAAVHFLVSITRVCLRHYEDLQKKHGTLPLDARSLMVVDMERWGNRVRAAKALAMAK
ncbi:MAG: hypothetical protein KF734_21080 [Saprospiraceae bacterium]|nr:hypothetical protein [Saprospiraceae bacterium]